MREVFAAGRVRVAAALWMVLAFVVWNVVFDREVILAGRAYLAAAVRADADSRPPVLIAEWMRPAVTKAFWLASLAGGAVAVVGLVGVLLGARQMASRADRYFVRTSSKNRTARGSPD